jgi:sn-glycerol 3-phosphate transport system ATP-binding protein
MEAPFVQINNVAKRWNGQLGVQDISLSIPRGSFVALLGPSGCGKSTTLRLLSGLELPDEGTIVMDGNDVTYAAPADRNLSMVFQSYALFPHLNVTENVIFGLKVRKVNAEERKNKLRKALEITGLVGYENRKPGELSGGQRQRVALARAIVANQPLCLMDEPLSNLDAKLRTSVRNTVVYVTHDQTEAMSMADIVVLMKDGEIQQAGTPQELYYKPLNTFVAEFVGDPPMALIDASVLPGIDNNIARIGLRAENTSVVGDGEGRLSCKVTECEFLGSETHVGLAHPGTKGLTVILPGLCNIEVGENMDITFSNDDLHFFDFAGQRLA